jgi:hypothetical protein
MVCGAGAISERGQRDVVTCQKDEIRLECVGGSYCISNELSARLGIMMKVAQVGNSKPVKFTGQARKPDLGSFYKLSTWFD